MNHISLIKSLYTLLQNIIGTKIYEAFNEAVISSHIIQQIGQLRLFSSVKIY